MHSAAPALPPPLSSLCTVPPRHTLPTHQSHLCHCALTSLGSRTCTGFLHPQKGGPLEAHKTNMPLSLTSLIRFSPYRSIAAPHLPFLEWGEGSSLKPPQHSHLSPASGERDKRKEELWVLFHETPRFCTKMQGVLLFAFFLSFLKITMKLSFPPTAFSLSYLD